MSAERQKIGNFERRRQREVLAGLNPGVLADFQMRITQKNWNGDEMAVRQEREYQGGRSMADLADRKIR